MKRPIVTRSVLALAAALLVPPAFAGPITLPAGLQPGDHYQLAFVTAGTRDALSPNIADYNAFVTAQANLSPDLAALATTWRAIAYAADGPSAKDNAQIVGPVFRTDGLLVADDSAEFFFGTWANVIAYDQFGEFDHQTRIVWTGTYPTAPWYDTMPLGSRAELPLDQRLAYFAFASAYADTLTNRLTAGWSYQANEFPLFAVSGDLVVPGAAVPEPGSLLLLGTGLIAATRAVRRRRARQARQTR
jgi:hypothetical protein